ncbi:MAG: hypothetical protein FJ146_18095 [Deltaproteobacteria bacterium]|nr:hypothetical protein [Deltaproteobacteria bacterium]
MVNKYIKLAILMVGLLESGPASAEDSNSVGQRWSVVGVISGDPLPNQQPTGIAVLRNNVTQRSYTLTIGDPIPAEYGFTLKNVLAKTVVIGNGATDVTLGFGEPPAEVQTPDVAPVDQLSPRVSKFLESYQQNLDNVESASEDITYDEVNDAIMVIPRAHSGGMGPAGRLGILQGPLLNLDDDFEEFD